MNLHNQCLRRIITPGDRGWSLCALLFLTVRLATDAQVAPAPLTSTRAVRELNRAVAALGLPVEVRGVVTFVHPGPHTSFVLEDRRTGVWVSDSHLPPAWWTKLPRLAPGMLVELRGETMSGGYAPAIRPRAIRVLGRETLPPANPVNLGDILTGVMDCQQVEWRGVVQYAQPMSGAKRAMQMQLAVPGQRFYFVVWDAGEWRPEQLVGATVRLTAVGSAFFNERAELVGVRMQMTDFNGLIIEQPAPADPFAVPEVPLSQLQPFSPHGPVLTRQRLVGTVTLGRAGEYLFVEEDGRAVRVNTRMPDTFVPGDRIEASGFVHLVRNFAELDEAVIRKVGTGATPFPLELKVAEVLLARKPAQNPLARADHHGRLVFFHGRLDYLEKTSAHGRRLVCSVDELSFAAELDARGGALRLDTLRAGSQVGVTGVCALEYGVARPVTDHPYPVAITVLLRSADDIVVLRMASWWTAQRIGWVLAGVSVLALGGGAWVLLLRREVRRQSTLLSEHEVRSAVADERTRIAGELHDDLGSDLAAIALLSQDLQNRASPREPEPAEVGRMHRVARRASQALRSIVWVLHADERQDLIGHLRELTGELLTGLDYEFEAPSAPLPAGLPLDFQKQLLFAFKETLQNIRKHADASRVHLALRVAAGRLRLEIRDNGRGFVVGATARRSGLRHLQHRASLLAGTVCVESRPGAGTTVVLDVPLPASVTRDTTTTPAQNQSLS